ncbi:uncharacterized protein A4U43_C07F7480 [Asparagus officinalis]|uniref:Uncharacterized protein n=1 Tax=Asparagus officinalis TaxID=4686 RepID=A0A5P1EA20_ASPOF|nr:uncharacterized protein LOC109849741 [Asparagus officinalis]ONK62725.1 uncharacterized protein A4U43_C07F7480 [Asparagus officinalis]
MDIPIPSKSLTFFKIFQESIKLPTKNKTLILPILFLHLLSNYLLYFFIHLSITPLLDDIILNAFSLSFTNNSQSPNFYYKPLYAIQKDTRELIIVEYVFFIVASAISWALNIAIIHVLSCTYKSYDNPLAPKDVLSKVIRTLRGPMITQLYITTFNLGYLFLIIPIIFVLALYYHPNSPFFIISSTILALMFILILSYMAIVWYVSIVISVVQENCYGLVAIGKAAKIIRGKRMQGTLIVFIEIFAITIIYWSHYRLLVCFYSSSEARLAVGFIYVVVYLVMNMLIWATSTVFYYECMKMYREVAEISMDGGCAYSPVSTTGFPEDKISAKLISDERC